MADLRRHLFEILENFDNAMLITRGRDGGMHARPMAVVHLSPGSDAFFATKDESEKVAEIEADPKVLVTFQSGGTYASLTGQARIVRDRVLVDRYWSKAWEVWFPEGKDDPSICIIAVLAERGEYWDSAGVQGVKYAFEAAKSLVTGKTPDLGQDQHAKVKL